MIEIPDLGDYICGVILNRETIEQKHDNGKFLREILRSKDIVYGVTLDFGPVTLHGGLPGKHFMMLTVAKVHSPWIQGIPKTLLNTVEPGVRNLGFRAFPGFRNLKHGNRDWCLI